MSNKSMTALVSCFARAYHFSNYKTHIFSDSFAISFLGDDSYNEIGNNMSQGISFFNPNFSGSNDEGLRWIVNNILSPTPLARAAFSLRKLENAVTIGAEQYIILGAGYDSTPYMALPYLDNVKVFEIDHPNTQKDKIIKTRKIIENNNIENLHYIGADLTLCHWEDKLLNIDCFDSNKITFTSIMGLSYYLSKEDLKSLLIRLSSITPKGSSICMDYFDKESFHPIPDKSMQKKIIMAKLANEEMKGMYTYKELESLLSECGYLIYEHLTPDQITKQYFKEFNSENPKDKMKAEGNVNYLLGVKE
jgi:methyltransferase (TIGR00027 family)